MQRIWLISTAVLTFAACTPVGSSDVGTRGGDTGGGDTGGGDTGGGGTGIYATFEALSNGANTTVQAVLRWDSPDSLTFVALAAGDQLFAHVTDPLSGMTTDLTMTEVVFGGVVWYEADFLAAAEDTEIRIELDRTATGQVSAPSSAATLPSPFVLTVSPTNGVFSRSDDVEIVEVLWFNGGSPVTDPIQVEISGTCIEDYVTTSFVWSTDAGLMFRGTDLNGRPGQEGSTCNVTVEVRLVRTGTVDSAFESAGSIYEAMQVRSLMLTAEP